SSATRLTGRMRARCCARFRRPRPSSKPRSSAYSEPTIHRDDMTQAGYSGERGRVIGLQERRLGPTVLRTYRAKVDIDDIVPNERQPRLGPKEDDELQLQIEANEGLFEPLLVEPHPDLS